MHNKVLIFLVTGMLILGISRLSFAMMCGSRYSNQPQLVQADTEHSHEATETTAQTKEEAFKSEPIEFGNKICPVSGEEIKEEEAFQVEHEGKIYNLCCKMCAKDFKKDPEKYIEKLKELEKKEEESQAGHTHEGHTHEHTH